MIWLLEFRRVLFRSLNNIEIKEKGKQKLQVGDVICAGETMLQVESLESQDTPAQTNYLETGASLPSDERSEESRVGKIDGVRGRTVTRNEVLSKTR